jgi:hypothetical protein
MSDAAAAVLAVDAISISLADRMAIILRDLPDIERKGQRYAAYHAGGINLSAFAKDETDDADLQAHSSELLRRLNP